MEAASIEGLVLEFGVRFGSSIRQIATLARQAVHGFDSFDGLPEAWHGEAKGSYSTGGVIPNVPSNVTLHKGWFDKTLPEFLQQNPGPIRFVNIDCDLYSSTKTILDELRDRVAKGTVIVFDEYLGNEHWQKDEFKVFQDCQFLRMEVPIPGPSACTPSRWWFSYSSFLPISKMSRAAGDRCAHPANISSLPDGVRPSM